MSLQSARDESERLKAALLDGALDCVVAIDDRGRVLEFNRAAEVTFGYTADEAIGSELADLVAPPDLRDEYRWELDPRPRNEGMAGRRVELTAMRKDGSTLPVEVAVRRVPGVEPPRAGPGGRRGATGARRRGGPARCAGASAPPRA